MATAEKFTKKAPEDEMIELLGRMRPLMGRSATDDVVDKVRDLLRDMEEFRAKHSAYADELKKREILLLRSFPAAEFDKP